MAVCSEAVAALSEGVLDDDDDDDVPDDDDVDDVEVDGDDGEDGRASEASACLDGCIARRGEARPVGRPPAPVLRCCSSCWNWRRKPAATFLRD